MERDKGGFILRKSCPRLLFNDGQRLFADGELIFIQPFRLPKQGIFNIQSLLCRSTAK